MTISLLTMGAGNVKVLKKTLESFKNVVDEVVYGDLLLFDEDRETLYSYQKEYNLKIVRFQFNYLFKYGFSALLNTLAWSAKNATVLYMNTGEIIDEDYGITETLKNNPDCNAFYFIHRTDHHRWYRTYNRNDLRWSGLIHEQLKGEYKPYHKPIFMMADLPKDMDDPHKANVLDSVKEIVYFEQYVKIVERPELLGETDPGWLNFATSDYDAFKSRLLAKGEQYAAFVDGSLKSLLNAFKHGSDFGNFKSSIALEYQNDKKYLL